MKTRKIAYFLAIVCLFFFVSNSALAQKRPVRYLQQHNSPYIKAKLETIEKMLIKTLDQHSQSMKLSAVQSMRQIEQIFPDEPFYSFIDPLIATIKDENNHTQLRITAAIVLDELHSDKGDAAIYEISQNCSDISVKNICIALSTESLKVDKQRFD